MTTSMTLLLPGLLLATAGALALSAPGEHPRGNDPTHGFQSPDEGEGNGTPSQDSESSPAEAAPEDVASIDAILAALYASISGPAGEERDWQRFESLFHPAARLQPIVPTGRDRFDLRDHSPRDYAEVAQPIFDQRPFYESELCRRVEQFGQLAHAFSTYESRNDPAEEAPFQRGINSIQLMQDGGRWWILSVVWDSERPGNPLPESYLGEGR